MDNKFYVSYEAARLLKEKGYNEECDTTIDDDGDLFEEKYFLNQDLPKWRWSCPTKAESIDWLESKGIVVEIWRPNFSTGWACSVEKNRILEYDSWMKDDILFPTRLEAEEAAIIKACELL